MRTELAVDLKYTDLLQNDSKIFLQKTATGNANGSFGELLQGVLPNNDHYLVTLPISCETKCTIKINENSNCLEVYPPHKKKSLKLAKKILQYFNLKLNGQIIIESDISEGKGLASSTADLIATIRAFEKILNHKISEEIIFQLLREIEPSDGVMYPGIVSFYHRKIQLREYLGSTPALAIVAFDEGGIIDTIEYNKKERIFTEENKKEYQYLLNRISFAVKNHDLATIGKVATRSAIMNQVHNPKKYLFNALEICERTDCLGVIVAHSGTYLGILIDMNDVKFSEKLESTLSCLNKISPHVKVYETLKL